MSEISINFALMLCTCPPRTFLSSVLALSACISALLAHVLLAPALSQDTCCELVDHCFGNHLKPPYATFGLLWRSFVSYHPW